MSKTYRIPFRADMLVAIENGKRATRRANRNWTKVKKGDVLLAHEGRHGKTAIRLVVTSDAFLQHLDKITAAQAEAEGVEREGTLWKNYFPEFCNKGKPFATAAASFFSLWDAINAHKAGMSRACNPEVVVIEFEPLSPTETGEDQ